jgi:hypothetical protein
VCECDTDSVCVSRFLGKFDEGHNLAKQASTEWFVVHCPFIGNWVRAAWKKVFRVESSYKVLFLQ